MADIMYELTPPISRSWSCLAAFATLILLAIGSLAGCSLSQNVSDTKLETTFTKQAGGKFDVTLTPEGVPDESEGTTLGRMSIDKVFHGDLEATSKGEMLSVRTSTEGSAGYVAIERVTGTLHGRSGSFVLQHSAVMTRGNPRLTLEIVPDSASDELKGLAGTMTINIVEGQHFYELVYELDEAD